jgi:hypothetical protein
MVVSHGIGASRMGLGMRACEVGAEMEGGWCWGCDRSA